MTGGIKLTYVPAKKPYEAAKIVIPATFVMRIQHRHKMPAATVHGRRVTMGPIVSAR